MDNKECTTCRLCGSGGLEPLFSLGNQLVNDFPLPADVGKGPRCPIEIVMCPRCGLAQQRWSAPQEILYRRQYHYRSGVTATMRAALQEVADKAVALVNLRPGDVVLDIGSNDGTGLRCYPEVAIRVGVEPADNLATPENYAGLELAHGFWGTADSVLKNGKYEWAVAVSVLKKRKAKNAWEKWEVSAKIISAVGMFYDLEDPGAFIRDVAKVLAPGGVFVAQLMCLRQMVDTNDVGNLCHEHLEFYSLRCLLGNLLRTAGLRCFDIEENAVNGGSYRLWCYHAGEGECRPEMRERLAQLTRFLDHEDGMRLNQAEALKGWWAGLEENRRKVRAFLKVQAELGRRIWVIGASTKGNTILQWLDLPSNVIEAAADRDPAKHGRCTVTGIPIKSEEAFRAARPDFALVLPHAFRKEIEAREAAWHAQGGRFVYVLPSFEVA